MCLDTIESIPKGVNVRLQERSDAGRRSPISELADIAATDPKPARLSRSMSRHVGDVAYPAEAVLLVLVAWELWVRLTNQPPYIMVPFTDVLRACFEDWGMLLHHTWVTIVESVVGFMLGTIVGIALALLIVSLRFAARGILPLIILYHVIPAIALAPILSIWFGFGLLPKVLLVANLVFFPVLLNTITGLRSTNPLQIQLFRSAGASWSQRFLHLRVPNALPQIFVGLKIGTTLAVIGAVVAEYVSASSGLGYYVLIANGNLDTKHLMVGVIYLGVTGLLFYAAINLIERVATPWHVSRRES